MLLTLSWADTYPPLVYRVVLCIFSNTSFLPTMDDPKQATKIKFRTVVSEVLSFVGNPVYKLTTDIVNPLNLHMKYLYLHIYIIIVNIYNYYLSAEYIWVYTHNKMFSGRNYISSSSNSIYGNFLHHTFIPSSNSFSIFIFFIFTLL